MLIEEVEVRPAFAAGTALWLGRTAATVSVAGRTRTLTGAALAADASDARRRAFAELTERVSAYQTGFAETHHVRRRVEDVTNAIWPSSLQSFAPWQVLPEFIDRTPDRAERTWCAGRRLMTGEPILVPAAAVHLGHVPEPGERPFDVITATGLACGKTYDDAVGAALREVIERHEIIVSWRTGVGITRLDVALLDVAILAVCRSLGLTPELFAVADGTLPATVVACTYGSSFSRFTCGSACAPTLRAAASKAALEALMLHWTFIHCERSEVVSVPTTSFEHVARAYPDGGDVVRWFRTHAERTKHAPREVDSTGDLVRAAETICGSVTATDVTNDITRRLGLSVVRVLVAGAVPRESDARCMHLGGRVQHLTDRPNTTPHPFG